tara:strand:+ start:1374 stop:1874 length:501 start_codon:yes stop_codon:yes gene_type:complete
MQLDELLKSKVRFHLGFNAGAQVPAGDRSRLEEAMSLIPDSYWYEQITYHIQRCDIAWKASAAIPDDYLDGARGTGVLNPSRQEIISGDVERTINTSDPLKGDEIFREIYLREGDRLAESLYVPNYRRPEVRRYAFERAGSEFILAVPGPADTAVGTRMMLSTNWA